MKFDIKKQKLRQRRNSISWYFLIKKMCVSLWLNLFVLIGSISAYSITGDEIHTWWHNNTEYNEDSPIKDNYLRCSTIYNVQVTDSNQTTVFNSFAYMSIPRSGLQKWEYTDPDEVEFANISKWTMSRSTFQSRMWPWLFSRSLWVFTYG